METKLNRRDAIRRMFQITAAITLSAATLPTFISCTPAGKKRIVFFFTGTGNSLWVASQLTDVPLSIPQVMKNLNITYEADEIGIVCPVYRGRVPQMVQRFMREAKLKASYFFGIVTYGSRPTDSTDAWDKLAQENGINFDYMNCVHMVDNFLPTFDMNQQREMEKSTDEDLAQVVADLNEHKQWKWPVTDEDREFRAMVVRMRGDHFPAESSRIFVVNRDRCVGCGFCSRVCPRGNWSFGNQGIAVTGDCEKCLACIHNCPQKAITMNEGDRNPEARYRHPKVTINQIVRANISSSDIKG